MIYHDRWFWSSNWFVLWLLACCVCTFMWEIPSWFVKCLLDVPTLWHVSSWKTCFWRLIFREKYLSWFLIVRYAFCKVCIWFERFLCLSSTFFIELAHDERDTYVNYPWSKISIWEKEQFLSWANKLMIFIIFLCFLIGLWTKHNIIYRWNHFFLFHSLWEICVNNNILF